MFTECHVKQFSLAVCGNLEEVPIRTSHACGYLKFLTGYIQALYKLTDVLNQAINRLHLAI